LEKSKQSLASMRIAIHSHRRAQEVFMGQESYPVFAGMLVGTAQSQEDILDVVAKWPQFLKQFGWKERSTTEHRSGLIIEKFLMSGRVCVSLSLVNSRQARAVLLVFQRLFIRQKIDVGVLCVGGDDAAKRVKAHLARLNGAVTVPVFLVAVGNNGSCRRNRP
jgi:hypothetical protein